LHQCNDNTSLLCYGLLSTIQNDPGSSPFLILSLPGPWYLPLPQSFRPWPDISAPAIALIALISAASPLYLLRRNDISAFHRYRVAAHLKARFFDHTPVQD